MSTSSASRKLTFPASTDPTQTQTVNVNTIGDVTIEAERTVLPLPPEPHQRHPPPYPNTRLHHQRRSAQQLPVAETSPLRSTTATRRRRHRVVRLGPRRRDLTFSLIGDNGGATLGTVTVTDGVATYVPDGSGPGVDSFDYIANDGRDDSAPATVTVTLTDEPNEPPTAVNDEMVTLANRIQPVDVLDNDIRPRSRHVVGDRWTQGTSGSVNCTTAGLCTYTPDAVADSAIHRQLHLHRQRPTRSHRRRDRERPRRPHTHVDDDGWFRRRGRHR